MVRLVWPVAMEPAPEEPRSCIKHLGVLGTGRACRDRGLDANRANALGIPATFFVYPGLIEERRWLWTREARRRLQSARPHVRHELARELVVSAEVENFVQWIKKPDFPRRTRVEAMLRLRYATRAFVASEADRETDRLGAAALLVASFRRAF
jgi:hypothetical protein